jgi:hypothetical protein
MFGHDDNYDILVLFSPKYVGTKPEISSTGCFGEETGSIGSQTVKKKYFLIVLWQIHPMEEIQMLFWSFQIKNSGTRCFK